MKPKQQHYQQLDYQERQTISICREMDLSIRAIARILNRSPSTVSPEISRNCRGATYSCHFAHQRFVRRRRHGRPAPKLALGNALFASVRALLLERWSPQPLAWLHCTPTRLPNALRTKLSTTSSTPNPEVSCAANSSPACA